jgi:hypothetical protein
VIRLIEQTSENGWFAAHLTDLLHHCGCLKIIDNQQGSQTARLVTFISETSWILPGITLSLVEFLRFSKLRTGAKGAGSYHI